MKQSVFAIISIIIWAATAAPVVAQSKDNLSKPDKDLYPHLVITKESAPGVSPPVIELNKRGVNLFLDKRFDEAVLYFRQAVEGAPKFLPVRLNLAIALLRAKRFEEATDICRQSLESVAGNEKFAGRFYVILGSALYQAHDYSESVASYRKALEFDQQDAQLFNDLGVALYRLQDNPASLVAFQSSLEINPDSAHTLNNYGVALYIARRYWEAVRIFQRAVKQKPEFAEVYNNLGIAYNSLGKKKEAQKSFLEAVRINPESNYAQYNLAVSYFNAGNREAAEKCLAILRKLDASLADKFQNQLYRRYVIDASTIK